jgi:K+-sensing histidine kinase KdpD
VTSSIGRWLHAALASAVPVAAITAVIALLEPRVPGLGLRVPALGLGVLYLLAVVPIALVYGSAAAGAVSVASMLAFRYFFLPPRYSLNPGTSERWSVLVAFVVAALVVSELASRSQREARRSARLANQQARLAEEQAALRRVATLAAYGTSPEELFAAVVEEVGRVFPVENVGLARYESGGTMTTVAISERLADSFPVGGRWPLGGTNVSTVVVETGRSARIDSYGDASGRLGVAMRERGLASSVGAPIVVEGRVWGV